MKKVIAIAVSIAVLATAGFAGAQVQQRFSDVDPDSPHADAIEWLVQHEITTGTGDGKFSPD